MGKYGAKKKKHFSGSTKRISGSTERELSSGKEKHLNSTTSDSVSNVSTILSTADFEAHSSTKIILVSLSALMSSIKKEFPEQFDEICPKELRDTIPNLEKEVNDANFFRRQSTLKALHTLYTIFSNNFEARRREYREEKAEQMLTAKEMAEKAEKKAEKMAERAERRFIVAAFFLFLFGGYFVHQYIEFLKVQKR